MSAGIGWRGPTAKRVGPRHPIPEKSHCDRSLSVAPSSAKYNAASILKLPEMEAIRRSAGMYIGNRQSYGLTHIAWEIVSNARDEGTAGFGRRIQVRLRANGAL